MINMACQLGGSVMMRYRDHTIPSDMRIVNLLLYCACMRRLIT